MKLILSENQMAKLAIQGNKRVKNMIFKLWDNITDYINRNEGALFSKTTEMLGLSPEKPTDMAKLGHMLCMYFLEWRNGIDENGNLNFSNLDKVLFKERNITTNNSNLQYLPFDYYVENEERPYDLVIKINIWGDIKKNTDIQTYYDDYGSDQLIEDIMYDIMEDLNDELFNQTGFFVVSIMEYVGKDYDN
jgi:hypothetical protein